MTYLKKREKLVADRAAADGEYRGYRADLVTMLDRLQAFLDDHRKPENQAWNKRKRLFLSEKSFKSQLQPRLDGSEKIEDL